MRLSTIAQLVKIASQRLSLRKSHETSNSDMYDQIAHSYDDDYGQIFKRVKREIEIELRQLPLTSPSIIDVGTGTGENILLAQKVFGSLGSVYGVDISEKMLAIAKEKYPPLHTVRASALNLTESIPAPADLIFMHFLLSYVSVDRLLPQIKQRLKPGGYISIASSLMSSWPRGQSLGRRLRLHPREVEQYIPLSSVDLRNKFAAAGLIEVDSIELRKRILFHSIEDVYRFGFEQGWVYQLFEYIHCAGQPEKFAREWSHIIPFDDELHIHIGIYKKP